MYLLRTISALHFPAPRTADIRDWGELIRLRALNADVYREHSALWAPASVFQRVLIENHCDVRPMERVTMLLLSVLLRLTKFHGSLSDLDDRDRLASRPISAQNHGELGQIASRSLSYT